MNIVSNHNRLLRGAAIPTAGGDMWTSGLEYTQNGEISGYSGSAFYQQECPCDSAAIVDSAFNKSTAWVDEQNYLTAHQDVTNLPYVQNSALEFSPQGLISGISGSGFYATSADAAFEADTAYFAYTANMAYSADEANAAKWASSAEYVYNGWELDGDNKITGYSGTAFAANNDYSGISPIVVNNELHLISAESAKLGVQTPLYFVEDTSSSTVIGIYESALSGRDWTDDITAASANALNEAINQITAVELANSALTAQTAINANHANSSDSATYDSLGRKIVDTYLTAHQELPDWTPTIQNASGNAYNSAVNWVVDQHYLTAVTGDNTPYTAGANIVINDHVISVDTAIELTDITGNRGTILDPSGLYVSDLDQSDYTEIGLDHVVSTDGSARIGWQLGNKEISVDVDSGNGDYAILHMSTADVMLEQRHPNPTPDAVYSLTGACQSAASAINMINSGDNQAYSAGANIDITNHVVSGKDWTTEIQAASAYAVDQAINTITAVASANSATYDSDGNKITETYISAHQDVSNLPYVQNSSLDYTPGGHLVSSISGDGLYAMSAEGAFTAETAIYSYVAETANYVADGWEYNESNEITGYSGSAIHSEAGGEGKVYTGVAPIVVDNSQTTGVISAQTAQLGVQSPLYFVTDTSAQTVIGISGLPDVEGLMYESALGKSDNKITGYNGTAFSAGSTYDVKASSNISVSTAGTTFTVSGKDWTNTITGASSYAYNQATANAAGKYIPYTATAANKYFTNSAIIVSAGSGFVEMNSKNDTHSGEAHIHVHQKPTNNGMDEWFAEIDGDGYGHIHQHWYPSTGAETAMWYEINGFTLSTGAFEPVAEWLTGDWINAKALYSHVNTASASWTNNIPYIATDTKTFVTNSAIQVTASALPVPGPGRYYYSTAQLGPSSLYAIDVTSQQGYSASGYTNILGSTVFLSASDTNDSTYERHIKPNSDNVYSGGNFIVDIVKAAVTVKNNSASWGGIPTKVVATSAGATGSNILYIVTGS